MPSHHPQGLVSRERCLVSGYRGRLISCSFLPKVTKQVVNFEMEITLIFPIVVQSFNWPREFFVSPDLGNVIFENTSTTLRRLTIKALFF